MLVPILTRLYAWLAAFVSGAAMALLCVAVASTFRETRVPPATLS